ncbi:laccase-12-like [Glycine soja]|uniref:Laccase n=1 Tax=Glycine soja TaxID=3848 RepID=A0A445HHG5_GLYSO|nr:laccase-12-like [Glycine soja]RZB73046.1 Laccase-5 [Glycine soja]
MESVKFINMNAKHSSIFLLALIFVLILASANAKIHEHEFVVEATPVKRLCKTHNSITVNGQYPGPTLEINNGDTLVVKVTNKARYNVTIHWHGVRQMRTGWADGPEFVTQCPIRPGGSYTYRFTVQGQEGTLWWHAHSSWLRATVYGALIIRPREGEPYPFPKPKHETPILLGEWWDANPIDVVRQATRTGGAPNVSDAYTINGQPGDLYKCSSKDTTIVPIHSGETNLLRVINAALNQPLFFTVANHKLTVVGADASYLKPFTTKVLMLGPGQTTDVLITGDQPPSPYYMAARAYQSAQNAAFDNTTTTAILEYKSPHHSNHSHHHSKGALKKKTKPIMPSLPAYNDTNTVTAFSKSFRSPRKVEVPDEIDQSLFFTVGLGINKCPKNFGPKRCQGPINGTRFTASMNNVSFVLPNNVSILQAHHLGIPGVFTTDFPGKPPVKFDYTGNVSRSLWQPVPGTKAHKLKFGSRVQIVLQDTSIVTPENHPIHLHGYDFYIVAEGFGNFDAKKDTAKFNLVDPPLRNTVAVPVNGWAVIRFVADNPGAWLLHCHLDVHIGWGLATVLLVENGVGKLQSIEPPPLDLPLC